MVVWEILNLISGGLPLSMQEATTYSVSWRNLGIVTCMKVPFILYHSFQGVDCRPRNPGMEKGEEVMSLQETCRRLRHATVLRHAREAGCCGRIRTPLLPPDSLCLVRLHFEHVLGHLGAVQGCLHGLEERVRVVGVRDVLDQQLARLYDLVLILE